MIHNFSPGADISQLVNATGDLTSETWSELIENENLNFWTNQSTIDLNDTLLGMPENRTVLISGKLNDRS